MPKSNAVYSLPANGRTGGHDNQVREDEGDYGDTLLALTDTIQGKLRKAEALAWILHSANEYPHGAETVSAAVIAEFIREASEAHERQWEKVREYRKYEK